MTGPLFHAEEDPSTAALLELAALCPTVPSYTPAYVAARGRLGLEPWLLALRQEARLVTGCTAFLRRRAWLRSLQLVSCPPLPPGESFVFWDGLSRFCRDQGIALLQVDSYGSPSAAIPHQPGEVERTERTEHVLDLRDLEAKAALSRHHRRKVKQARRAGVEVRRRDDRDAVETHRSLLSASFRRRRERGETVPEVAGIDALSAYVEEGAGELFEATLDGQVVSSVLVTMAEGAGYYESAGTSREGLNCGASHLLVAEMARGLAERGLAQLNLGGSRYPEEGLRRFKAGFGGRVVPLVATRVVVGDRWKRKAIQALRLLRHDPKAFLGRAVVRRERFLVYEARPRDMPEPREVDGWTWRKLTDADLEDLAERYEEARMDFDRRQREGFNGAYGVFVDGELANVTWLVTAEQDRLRPIRNAKLRPGEVEITHGFTRPTFRGRGVWPYVIAHIRQTAEAAGAKRVLGMHLAENASSRRAIERAGYVYAGTVLRLVFPVLLGGRAITLRGHRRRKPAGD